MTLTAVLMLGGVTGGRGDELSGAAGSAPYGGFALPDLPWNWSDLPVRLTASQTVSYNSNVFGVPTGGLAGPAQGDFTSNSSFGLSTKANWSGQQFFFDGTFGELRYLHNRQFNSNVYSFSPGVNWTLTSRCAGTLVGLFSKSPSTITEQVGSGINYATNTSLSETGKCAVSNGYSVLFNASTAESTNSNALNAANNARTQMIAAGVEYAKGPDSLSALASISNSNYSNRGAVLNQIGLLNSIAYHSFNLSYTRQINPNLTVTGQIGLVGVTNEFSIGLPKSLLPTYSIGVTWALTPKISLAANAARNVAPPTTTISNAEVSYASTMTLTYQATPKVTFNATGSTGYSNSAFTPGLAGTLNGLVGTTKYYSANAGVMYSMTPFLSAGLTATYVKRIQGGLITPQDLITVSLNYRPF